MCKLMFTEQNLTWDNLDPDGIAWDYPRAELRFKNFLLGSYSKWAPESLKRDDLDPKKPIHAWVCTASFIDGKHYRNRSQWFSDEADAKKWLVEEALKELNQGSDVAPAEPLPSQTSGVKVAPAAIYQIIQPFRDEKGYLPDYHISKVCREIAAGLSFASVQGDVDPYAAMKRYGERGKHRHANLLADFNQSKRMLLACIEDQETRENVAELLMLAEERGKLGARD